jgi:hypothetical protein
MVEQTAIPTGDAGKFTKADLYDEVFRLSGMEETTQLEAIESPTEVKPEEELEAETPTEDVVTEQEEPVVEETKEEDKWIPKSLDELAEALEVDQDAVKAIKIRTKVDGVEADVPLGEVIKNYQLNKALTERSEALAHERKTLEQQAKAYMADYQAKLEDFGSWQGILETRLREQVASVDWQQLREEDPAEYAARRQEFTERIAEIENMKASMQQHRQAVQTQQQQAYLQQLEQVVSENIRKLPEIIPEYKDDDFRKKDMASIKDYLVKSGFGEEEVKTVFDARQVAIARKAMLYDQMQNKVEPKAKLMKDKPKFIRPGAKDTADQLANKDSQKRIQRALKSQNTDDWANVLIDRLGL